MTAWAIGIPCAGVGFLVTRRQPANPLGWLFLACAGCLFIANDGGDYSYFVYRLGHHLPFGPLALGLDELSILGLVLFLVVTLLFPDGRPTSRFWRWGLRALCALFIALPMRWPRRWPALGARPLGSDSSRRALCGRQSLRLVRGRRGPVPDRVPRLSLGFICARC